MARIDRDDMFMEMALIASKRSECKRKKVGAILTLENRIICMGYNGVLPGVDPKEGLDEDGISHTVHAEANIISFCAKKGIATEGATLYITLSPCEKCAELIVQSGIKKVLFHELYRITDGIHILNENKIKSFLCHPTIR